MGQELPTFTTNNDVDDEDAIEQLEACRYELVTDVLETKGGTWELIDKVPHSFHFSIYNISLIIVLQLPPNIRIVHRWSDPTKLEFIAKHVREKPNELAIHEFLDTRWPQSPYVTSLIAVTQSTPRSGSFYRSCTLFAINASWTAAVSLVMSSLTWVSSRGSHIFMSTNCTSRCQAGQPCL